ncbi:hypothetical protein Tco_0282578 [Tanacetum coccineum]
MSKVPDTKDMIKFMLDTEEFTYTVDMFRVTLHLLVETPENLFVAPVNIQTIEAFMNRVSYQGVVDKVSAFYTKNLAQPRKTMFKMFNRYLTTRTSGHDQTKINILQLFHAVINQTNIDYAALLWIDEDYHSIKDDIPLASVYTTGNVLVRGMLIPDEFLTKEIRATDDFKEYEMVFVRVDVLMNQPQPVVSTQGTHRSTPRAYRTPIVMIERKRDEVAEATILSLRLHKTALAAEAQENIAKVQEKLDEEEIEKMVEGDEDEESYASVFADSMINNDVDDSEKQDEEFEKEKNGNKIEKEKNIDDVEITDEVVKEKDIDVATGIYEELTASVSPTTATTSKDSSTSKRKKWPISYKMKILPGSIAGMCRRLLDHCNKVVPELTFAKTNEMINNEMPRLVNLAVNKDHVVDPINAQEMISKKFATHAPKMIEELFRKHMQHTTLNLYPTTSSSTARKSTADLQQQLYLNMKSKPQDQAADPEL